MKVNSIKIVNLPKIEDDRGNLSFVEELIHIPFEIKRTYWTYDVPGGQKRGGHAYHKLQEFIIALSGSFDVVIDDGKEKRTYSLNRSYYGLYVPNMLWRSLENFSTNAFCLTFALEHYDEHDYIRDYQEYLNLIDGK